ncbi:MAG: DUF2190 family protein [Kiritimatiellaeota bacterium]|nr:DUF2190 family protein [Kiritimatiellota bacterium]
MKSRFLQSDGSMDHTPSANVAAGDIVVVGGVVGHAAYPIKAGELGALAITGLVRAQKASGALTAGQAVYWNPTGNPQGGAAGTGAVTAAAAGGTFMGWATKAAGATDETATVRLGWITPAPTT